MRAFLKRHRGKWIVLGVLALGAGLVALSLRPGPLPFTEADYLVTQPRQLPDLAAGQSWWRRVWWKAFVRYRQAHPNPAASWFPATAKSEDALHPCSIHGLLGQCTDVTGTRYFIPRAVASGSVDFGHTKTLNGSQWVAAFEGALRTNRLEWWSAERKGFAHEHLVLFRYPEQRVVLVLPQSQAQEFLRTNAPVRKQ